MCVCVCVCVCVCDSGGITLGYALRREERQLHNAESIMDWLE